MGEEGEMDEEETLFEMMNIDQREDNCTSIQTQTDDSMDYGQENSNENVMKNQQDQSITRQVSTPTL